MKKNSINLADNLDFLREVPNAAVDLIYIDPPFNTGTQQSITRLKTVRDEGGDRTGFDPLLASTRRASSIRGARKAM